MDYFSALDARQSVRRKVVPTMKVESFNGELRYGRIKTRDNRRPVEVVTMIYRSNSESEYAETIYAKKTPNSFDLHFRW